MKSQQSLKLRIMDYVFSFFKCRLKNVKSRVLLDFQKKKTKKTYSRTMVTTLRYVRAIAGSDEA